MKRMPTLPLKFITHFLIFTFILSNFTLPPSAFALRANQAIESGVVGKITAELGPVEKTSPESAVNEPQVNANFVILIVDDNKRYRETLGDVLEQKDFKVIKAGSGEETLDILQQNPQIKAIISNYTMLGKDINGLEVLKKAKETKPNLVTVLISDTTDDYLLRKEAEETGISTIFNKFIMKPEELRDFLIAERAKQTPPMGGGAGINDVLLILRDTKKNINVRIDEAVQRYRQDRDVGVIYPFSAIIKAQPEIWAWLVQTHCEEIAKALLTAAEEGKEAKIQALLEEAYEDVETNFYSRKDLEDSLQHLKGEIIFAAHGKGNKVASIMNSLLDKINEYWAADHTPAKTPNATAPSEVVDKDVQRETLTTAAGSTSDKKPEDTTVVSPLTAKAVTKKTGAPALGEVKDKNRLINEVIRRFLDKIDTKRPLAKDDIKELLTLLLKNTVTLEDIRTVLRKTSSSTSNRLTSERMATIIGFIKETYLSIMIEAYSKPPLDENEQLVTDLKLLENRQLELLNSFRLATQTANGGDQQFRLQFLSTLRKRGLISDKVSANFMGALTALNRNQGPAQGPKGAVPSGGVGIGVVSDHIINAFKTGKVKENAAQIWGDIQGDMKEGLYGLADIIRVVNEKIGSNSTFNELIKIKDEIATFILFSDLSSYPLLPQYPADDNYSESSFLKFCNEKLTEGVERESMIIVVPPEVIFNENIIGWVEALLDLTQRQTKAASGRPQFKIIVPVSTVEAKSKIENLHLPGVSVEIKSQFAGKPIREIVQMMQISEFIEEGRTWRKSRGIVLPPTTDTQTQAAELENEQFYYSVLGVASSKQNQVISAFSILEDLAKRMSNKDSKKVNIILPIELPEDLYKEFDLYFEKIKYLSSQV